ncbi:hypothetical protein [Deinococcus alpinitundrae]|nr:hypothetical protein [Deinococcus alpinitundrae]
MPEDTLVFTAHLPGAQQRAWALLASLLERFLLPFLIEHDL